MDSMLITKVPPLILTEGFVPDRYLRYLSSVKRRLKLMRSEIRRSPIGSLLSG